MDEKKYSVYIHRNKINNKVYVGITSQRVERRWRDGKGYPHNSYFTRSILKYGWHNFEHIVLCTNLSKNDAENMETNLIKDIFMSNKFNYGYNQTIGGDGVREYICSEATRKKLSERSKGVNNHFYGKKHTEETRRKIREAHKYIQKGEEHPSAKQVICLETKQIYKYISEAAKMLGINNSTIGKCCKGNAKTAGGYHWMYYNDYIIGKDYEINNKPIKKVICLELEKVFESTSEAGKFFNSNGHIKECCEGKRKIVGGYHWMYYEDYLKLHNETNEVDVAI